MKKITGRIWTNKILSDPSNNIDISQTISNQFKNTKTKEELESIKKFSQDTIKNVFNAYKYFTKFFIIVGIVALVSLTVVIPIAVIINIYALYTLLFTFFSSFATMLFYWMIFVIPRKMNPEWYWTFRKFLVEIRNNLCDDPNKFPLTLQVLYFNEIYKQLTFRSKLKVIVYNPPTSGVGSYWMIAQWANFRTFIEFPNFIIKYVDYCLSHN